ncbi:MAG: glycoside hydrolase family 1 protein [Deltaproteobacteria bacterium]|nr:glycoside hydrolase family 1 protein [Deltaproteobacteria bacterium]
MRASELPSRLLFLVPLVLASCGDSTEDPAPNPNANFPKTFLWGTAVAGFQSDMGCPTLSADTCEDRASDWYQWVSDPDLIADPTTYVTGEPLANAPGMFELYKEDLARAKNELGNNAMRVSIEWSRLFPDADAEDANTVDELVPHAKPEAVAYYRALFSEMKRLGLTPLVTLNHYTLPLWIHDGKACHANLDTCEDRGWLDGPRIQRAIALYAGYCARTFGDHVDLWATLNEPFATVLAGYVLPSAERSHPPGVQFRIPEAMAVLVNQIVAHARMIDAVRAEDKVDADGDGKPVRAGTVVNIAIFQPKDPSDPDGPAAARHASWVHNELFLEGVATGRLDENVDGVLEAARPDLVGRLDWIGINYYTSIGVTTFPGGLSPDYAWLDFFPAVDDGFFVSYPQGMYESLALANRFGLPMIVTENGTPDAAATGDSFLKPHLASVARALAEGMPVEGYFFWTLVDNYEWNHGMALKLGLFALDPATKGRTLRPMGEAYRDIVRARGF